MDRRIINWVQHRIYHVLLTTLRPLGSSSQYRTRHSIVYLRAIEREQVRFL